MRLGGGRTPLALRQVSNNLVESYMNTLQTLISNGHLNTSRFGAVNTAHHSTATDSSPNTSRLKDARLPPTADGVRDALLRGGPLPWQWRMRVAIVGASFSGLACACKLQQFGVGVTVYEQEASVDDGLGGEIELRCGTAAIAAVGLSWNELRSASRSCHHHHSIPIRAIRHALIQQLLPGTVRFGHGVIECTAACTHADRSLQPLRKRGRAKHPHAMEIDPSHRRVVCHFTDGTSSQEEFDMVVDASGLKRGLMSHAAIGDARLAQLGWWTSLCGGTQVRRYRHGAVDALKDGVLLGTILGERACWRQRRQGIMLDSFALAKEPPGQSMQRDEIATDVSAHWKASQVLMRTDGILSDHLATLHDAVFQNAPIDNAAWRQRMQPRHSWTLCTCCSFLVAHRHQTPSGPAIHVWLAGVMDHARGTGEFRKLVRQLLREVGICARLTMTTRADRFASMFAILSRYATRCDEPQDIYAGEVEFVVAGWVVLLALHRRCVLAAALSMILTAASHIVFHAMLHVYWAAPTFLCGVAVFLDHWGRYRL